MIREPAVSGQFYPDKPAPLTKLVEKFVDNNNSQRQSALAVVCPHAGLVYSGAVAGAVFSKIKLTDTIIIIGPNHTGRGRPFSLMADGAWNMPFGEIRIDSELAADLLKNSRFIQDDVTAHAFEHSIEVQLPFIQYFKKDARFVPLILSNSDLAAYREIGEDIAKTIKKSKKDVLIVASSDMTHYEPQQIAAKKDKEAIDAILELNEEKLLDNIKKFDISMCGYAPVVAMLAAAKKLGAKSAELVKYQTSGEATGDYVAVVGYAGIIVY